MQVFAAHLAYSMHHDSFLTTPVMILFVCIILCLFRFLTKIAISHCD